MLPNSWARLGSHDVAPGGAADAYCKICRASTCSTIKRTPLATSRTDKSFAARWRTKLHRKLWSTTCGVSEVSGTGTHALDDRTEISSGERRTKAVFKSFEKWRAACRAPSRCAAFSISETPDPNSCQLRHHMFTLTTTSYRPDEWGRELARPESWREGRRHRLAMCYGRTDRLSVRGG